MKVGALVCRTSAAPVTPGKGKQSPWSHLEVQSRSQTPADKPKNIL